MKRVLAVDILRFVSAFMVVLFHSNYFCKDIVNIIPRYAVPVFFMISGFFMYESDIQRFKERLNRSIIKMIVITLVASLFFFFFYLPLYLRDGFPPLNTYINFIVFNENPFAFHLWYLTAFLYVLMLFRALVGTHVLKGIISYSPFLLLINLLLGELGFLFWIDSLPNYMLRDFLLEGLPCYSLGCLISINKEKLLMSGRMFSSALMTVVAFSLMEYYYIKQWGCVEMATSTDLYFSSVLFSVVILIWSIQPHSLNRIGEKVAEWGRKYSLDIYIFHVAFLVIIRSALKNNEDVLNVYSSFLEPIIVFLSAWGFAVVWYWIKQRIPFLNKYL